MHEKSDAQLLRNYAQHSDETAFAELIRRHTNLVYSAAARQVDSPDLAAEVAQSVFIGLARGAQSLIPRLAPDASLAGWLCRSARNVSLNLQRDEFRRHSRERQAMQQLDSISESAPDWEQLRPVLDEAMSELDETDYDALVLRFFKNQDLRSVGLAQGVSDDTAQKRVSRALDKLRDYLSRRGIRTTTTALSVVLTTNAVQAAPVGLALTISSAAALAGTTITATATTTATKAIAMTTLQKTLVAATLVAAVGTGIYEARQASKLRNQVQTLQQQQAPLAKQIQQLQSERDDATNRLAGLLEDNMRLNRNTAELLKLRGEIGQLREANQSNSAPRAIQDSIQSEAIALVNRVVQIRNWLALYPDQNIPELRVLLNSDWLLAVTPIDNWEGTEKQFNYATSLLRKRAKERVVRDIGEALASYVTDSQGQLPGTLSELRHYLEPEVTDDMLARYELLHKGNLSTVSMKDPIISEKAVLQDGPFDAIYTIGAFGYSYQQVNAPGSSRSVELPGNTQLKAFIKQ